MQVTHRECIAAQAALVEWSKLPAPFATRLRAATLLRVLTPIAQDFQTARTAAYRDHAETIDGQAQGVRRDAGDAAIYKVSATDELQISADLNVMLDQIIDVAADPLTLADVPARVDKADNQVTPAILAALGPFLSLGGAA